MTLVILSAILIFNIFIAASVNEQMNEKGASLLTSIIIMILTTVTCVLVAIGVFNYNVNNSYSNGEYVNDKVCVSSVETEDRYGQPTGECVQYETNLVSRDKYIEENQNKWIYTAASVAFLPYMIVMSVYLGSRNKNSRTEVN